VIELLLAQPWQAAVAAPLIGAALAFVIPHARASWIVAALAMAAGAGFAINATMRGAGGADGVALAAAPLIAALGTLVLVAAGGTLRELHRRVTPLAMALALCAPAAWMLALLAQDWITFAVAVEAAWLAGVALTALGGADRAALNGALRMLAGGGVSAALMLIGLGLVSRASGGMELAALAQLDNATVGAAGLALVLASLGLKAALAPLHAWAGAALGRAAAFPAMVVGVVGLNGALAALARVSAAAAATPALAHSVEMALAALGAASIVIGSVQAVGATNLRRLAMYAFASQAGCVLLSISLGSPAGFAAALVQMFALAAASVALFVGAAAARVASFDALGGLGRRMPVAGATLSLGALSLMGAPLTIGFVGRWRLIEAAVGAGWWWVAGVALLASLAAVFYGGRLIERIYFRRSTTVTAADTDVWRIAFVLPLLTAISAMGLGFDASPLLDVSERAAALIFGLAGP
jgi:formate hydrogenlyase subunit 3/multisubunit Na+/H+ antiporter MnhD subunit